jgi:hypothetical protein
MRTTTLLTLVLITGCGGSTAEICNAVEVTTYRDADGDGYGVPGSQEETCGNPEGRSAQAGDCDDDVADIFPGNFEICDGLDNNCTGVIDDNLPTKTYYADTDGDGFGDPGAPLDACMEPTGYVLDDTDCDDTTAANNINGLEVCDGVDNDCDFLIDDEDPDTDTDTMLDWFTDADGDGFGGGDSIRRCEASPQATNDGSDCDDTNASINPNGQEVCSGLDEDCDTLFDNADPDLDLTTQTTFWLDSDNDGFGDILNDADACSLPAGYAANPDDCDDSNPDAGIVDDWLLDGDGDGVGAGAVVGFGCYPPYDGTARLSEGDDCDDANADMFPGNTEICGDRIDQDCSGNDTPCGVIGRFNVHDGAAWGNNPPVYNCLEACAFLFGGLATDYQCSTSDVVVDNRAFVSGYADAQYCTNPAPEDFSLENPAIPGYNCGAFGCSYSAYVQDNCAGAADTYCWL